MIRFKSFWYGNSSLDLRQVIVKTRKLSSNVYSPQQPQHKRQIQRMLIKGIILMYRKSHRILWTAKVQINCSPDWRLRLRVLTRTCQFRSQKLIIMVRKVLENAQFIGRLLGWWLSKVTIKNHLGGGCWGRFLLRLSLSNIILRRGGVSRPSPPAGQIWLRVRCEVLHKTRVRTYDVLWHTPGPWHCTPLPPSLVHYVQSLWVTQIVMFH